MLSKNIRKQIHLDKFQCCAFNLPRYSCFNEIQISLLQFAKTWIFFGGGGSKLTAMKGRGWGWALAEKIRLGHCCLKRMFYWLSKLTCCQFHDEFVWEVFAVHQNVLLIIYLQAWPSQALIDHYSKLNLC